LHHPDFIIRTYSIRLFFKIANGSAIHQNPHMFAKCALIIQNISAKTWIGTKDIVEYMANSEAIRLHGRAIHVAAQVCCEVNLSHATTLAL
jgi:hypothetical protein